MRSLIVALLIEMLVYPVYFIGFRENTKQIIGAYYVFL